MCSSGHDAEHMGRCPGDQGVRLPNVVDAKDCFGIHLETPLPGKQGCVFDDFCPLRTLSHPLGGAVEAHVRPGVAQVARRREVPRFGVTFGAPFGMLLCSVSTLVLHRSRYQFLRCAGIDFMATFDRFGR